MGAGVLLVLLPACGTQGVGRTGVAALQPSDGRSGLYLSGTVAGRQLAVTDGAPRLIVGDCDPGDGPDEDVCVVSRDIDATFVRIVFANPDVLVDGAVVPVADPGCGRRCDDVTDVAVVDVEANGARVRAIDGRVRVTTVQPFLRYAGSLTLRLPEGSVTGDLNVVPRPEEDA